ncbi:DNA polymerase III subunit epsilon [Asticcacaulis machinosus]|uniref:DNA polymerase III subunit epsilon n=1 Tax=Asticcacaulis machinosus TaxID=2984211 RepID=A0ABT5HMF8_9CAUL|nr:DNA polymerase III subunit epsilon [Asticcacaulis machinosus]MDC7676779.1 DNA polymerase III subunit epsilon [Asticcacaulis machinosus]
MAREIVFDTETTGIDHRGGHRLIELGCVELEDLLPTGRTFHRYVDPERIIEADATRIHGITNEMVAGKPKFSAIADEFLEFVGDSRIIAHNASFDRNFINMELERINRAPLPSTQWLDTLEVARNVFPGMANSLDALCKRYNISLIERDKHGALLDARLLATVYLELMGGKERGLDLAMASDFGEDGGKFVAKPYGVRAKPLPPRIHPEEAEAHKAFIAKYLKDKALWPTDTNY